MRQFFPLAVQDVQDFKRKIVERASYVEDFCMLESNNYEGYPYSTFGSFIAIDSIEKLEINARAGALDIFQKYISTKEDWLFGYFNYDLKNELLEFGSFPEDNIWSPLYFFVPRWLIKIENDKVFLGVRNPEEIVFFNNFLDLNPPPHFSTKLQLTYIPDKKEYIDNIAKLKEHIQRGDFYEINYCIRWEAEGLLNITDVFEHINELSMAPFTCFFRQGHRYMVCASPERFLKKKSKKLIAQPIKGTKARSQVPEEDLYQKEILNNLEKERTENIMIVDLVRNDLSMVASSGTVFVEELCQVYSFKQVHQMISTVTAQLEGNVPLSDIIKATFPMGSMTGAPKQSAAITIEKYEDFNRDLFSGAIGYITPKRDFDFNVVIRSVFYDSNTQKLRVATGSAITFDCDAEAEYQECLLKARALLSIMQLG